jgi:hypothetical protein
MDGGVDQPAIPACASAIPALRSLTLLPSISANDVLGEFRDGLADGTGVVVVVDCHQHGVARGHRRWGAC